MFQNYFKTAWRNILRNKRYAIINIAGLSVGIAASILLFLVIQFHSGFDDFHPKKDQIYRVGTAFTADDGIDYTSGISFPVANGLRLDFPEIKEIAAINRTSNQISLDGPSGEKRKFTEENFYYTEPEFFKLFHFPFISGSAEASLKDPNGAVLTKSAAEKYFGTWQNAIGKTFTVNNQNSFSVTGILQSVPENSDFPLEIVVPFEALKQTGVKNNLEDWVSTSRGLNTYILLPENISPGQMNDRLKAFARKHKPAEYAKDAYILQPLKEIHFDERFGNFNRRTFSHTLIKALGLIGIFLLLIACINFINLATAQAVNRSKEVGIRKVLGGKRNQLLGQFLMEIALIVLMAFTLAIGIAWFALPFLNQLLDINMAFHLFHNLTLLIFIVITFLVTTIVSGLYPSLFLSGFNPVKALMNKRIVASTGGISLRRILVVFQFVIAQILVIAMLIVISQLKFFKNASLGFNKDQIVNVNIPGDSLAKTKIDFLRNALLANPGIEQVSFSFASPSSAGNWFSDFKYDHSPNTTNFNANLKWADTGYFNLYDLEFIAGKPYSEGDTVQGMVVNENLLKRLGVSDPEQAISKELNFWDDDLKGEIVGVIKDFNTNSLREPLSPVVLATWKSNYRIANIKVKAGREKVTLAFIEKLWNNTLPDAVFTYSFLDETINNFYNAENQLAQLYKIFAFLAIFISCLGLYGLVSFMAIQRTKEVGIRKVLGASSGHIVYLLSREFTLLILLAFFVSAPIAWYAMHEWLQNYTYRVTINPLVFVLAIAGSVVVAWITVGHRALKAANANPVESLRME